MKIFAEKKLIYIIEIIFLGFLIMAMLYTSIITRRVIALVLLFISLFCMKFMKSDAGGNVHSNQVSLLVFLVSIVYIMTLYLLGLYFGFFRSTVQFSLKSIKLYIIPYIIIIFSSETIRKSLYLKSENIFSKILITISFILLDVILATDIKNLGGLEDYVNIISFVVFSAVANNLLLNYMVNGFKMIKANVIYKIITTMYVFFIPITPNIYIFFESIIRMLIPYVIYIILDGIYNRKNIIKSSKRKMEERVFAVITAIISISIVMLVSCKFTYGVLVIGSGSMTGTIDKGDIIFYKKNTNEDVNIGEIIVFYKENVTTIHRVINIKESSDGLKYYTKGDANKQRDKGYIKRSDIIGRVLFKIPYIGYMNLWIGDLFD